MSNYAIVVVGGDGLREREREFYYIFGVFCWV